MERGALHIGAPSRRRPAPPEGQWVRVRTALSGIGEADLALAIGDTQGTAAQIIPQPLRRYLGREVVGEVTEVGADVTTARIGDRVTLTGEVLSSCATLGLLPPCRSCASGNAALCEHRAVPWGGTGAGWGDEMIVHESQLFLVPEALHMEQAVLLEPAARAVRAVLHRLPEPGMVTLILGGNMVGSLIAAILHTLVPSATVALATDAPHEIEAARAAGVREILPTAPNALLQRGAHLTNAQTFERRGATYVLGGFDIIYDCLGTGASLAGAVQLTRSGGLVAIVAAPARAVRMDPMLVQQDEISIVGVAGAGSEPPPPDLAEAQGGRWSSMAVAARMLRKGQIAPETMITGQMAGRQLRPALKRARQGAMRIVLTWN